MNATRAVERLVVMGGDTQVASEVGLHLLGKLADRCGLTSAYSAAVPWTGSALRATTVAACWPRWR